MRTKLIVGAAIMAVSLFTSVAQNVYSLNVVGYYNVTVAGNGNFTFVANQLKTANNTIAEVIPPTAALEANSVKVLGYNKASGLFQENVVVGGLWYDSVLETESGTTTILAPGMSFMFNNPGPTFTQTFVGEVEQGTLTVNILPGLNAISSKTPQVMDLSGNGFPQTGELIVYMLQPTGLYSFYQLIDGTWYDTVLEIPVNPTPQVGVGIFVENTGTSTFPWTRNFTVQ